MKKTLLAVAMAGLVLLPMPVASAAEPVQLVSINQAGTATGSALSYDGSSAASYGGFGSLNTSRPVTSRDGRFVVFSSLATDLVSTPVAKPTSSDATRSPGRPPRSASAAPAERATLHRPGATSAPTGGT